MKSVSWFFSEFCILGGVTLDVLWVCRLEVRRKICWSVQAVLPPVFLPNFSAQSRLNTFAFFLLCIYLLSQDRIGLSSPGFSKTKWIFSKC